MRKTKKIRFEAEIKWGTYDIPEIDYFIPDDFNDAKKLWESLKKEDQKTACDIIASHLVCLFIPGNIFVDDEIWEEVFAFENEIQSTNVSIRKLDFSEGLVPKVVARALFELDMKTDFDISRLPNWQEENDYLDHGVVFKWDFHENMKEEDYNKWGTELGGSLGLSFMPIDMLTP